jgi:Cu-Zn family superoxide dismutase
VSSAIRYSATILTLALAGGDPSAKAVLRDVEGREVGKFEASQGPGAIRIRVSMDNLPPGAHGLHVHAGASCGVPPFDSAGPHFDPTHADQHGGPLGNGHAGDLGNIVIGENGKGKIDFVTRRLSLGSDSLSLRGRTVVLHAELDNLTDIPPNGGSGARIACGAIIFKN